MATISFNQKRGLIQYGFKDVGIRQKKESDHWSKLEEGQELKVFWKMRSKDKELLLETEVAEDPIVIEPSELTDELADKAGFDGVKDLKNHLKSKYGKDWEDHEYVVIMWRT